MRICLVFLMSVVMSLVAAPSFAVADKISLASTNGALEEKQSRFVEANGPVCIEQKTTNTICLDLDRALVMTLANNRSIQSAYLNRVLDKYNLYVAQDLFIPDLNVTLAGTSQEAGDGAERLGTNSIGVSYGVSAFLPTGGQVSLGMDTNTARSRNRAVNATDRLSSSNVNFSFVQPLLRGAGYRVARSSLKSAEIVEKGNILGLKSLLIDTISEAIIAYRSYQLELKQLAITETSLERARALVATTQSLIDAGRVAPVELVQAEVTVAQRELSFESAKNSVDNARLNLLSILDIGLDAELILMEQEAFPKFVENTIDYFFNVALDNQPAYLQSLLDLELSEIGVHVAKNNRLWDLDATFSASLAGNEDGGLGAAFDGLRRNQVDLQAGLTLTIPFGDRSRRQSVLSARLNRQQQALAIAEIKESLQISVRNQVRTVHSLWAQLKLARQSETLVRKQLDAENIRFGLGRSTNFRVVEFEDQLILAQLDTASIGTDYLNALTELDRLLGTSLEVWNISFQAQRFNVREIKDAYVRGKTSPEEEL